MNLHANFKRTGKIARLPQAIRHELNERLEDGESSQHLVAWLNESALVRERLEEYHHGRPITEQNLSDWKQGGFRDWQRHQESRGLAREFLSEAEELGDELGETALTDRVTEMVAVVLLRLFREAAALESGPEQRRAVLEIARELARLRRGDHQRQRVRLLVEGKQRELDEREPTFEIEHAWRAEEWRQLEAHLERLRFRGESYRSEYVTGRADGTLTRERAEWIEAFFERQAANLRDVDVADLPHEEEEEQEEEEVKVAPRSRKPRARKKTPRPAPASAEASAGKSGGTEGEGVLESAATLEASQPPSPSPE